MTTNAWKGLVAGIAIGGAALGVAAIIAAPEARAARATSAANAASPTITVYKSATCGCCKLWVTYLEENGFTVVTHDVSDAELDKTKAANGVAAAFQSCHTALVAGYVIEGHVPVAEIKKMLAERPKIAGLAVPGMVQGSPGMPGASPQHYDVMAFQKNGSATVYAKH